MKKILNMLLAVCLCCGMLMGCGNTEKNGPVAEDGSMSDENVTREEVQDNTDESVEAISENDVLPHDNSIKLSDTKETIGSKENLTESEYGIEGLWNSDATWHVEDSDFEVSYSFAEDGTLQYMMYMLVDSSLDEIQLGFTEVTANYELQKLYGDGEGSWIVKSGDKLFSVTMEVDESSILVKIMPA